MLFIVIWHAIIHGIIISKNVDLTNLSQIEIGNYGIIQLLAYLTSISVNCFVLISGYFSINSKRVNYDRIIKVWLQTFFYSFIIYLLLSVLGVLPCKITTIIRTLLPVCTKQYWFITCYIPLMLISPYISKMITENSNKDNTKILIIFSFLTLTFISFPSFSIPIGYINTYGDNIIWFIYLYIVGGYIRLYEPFIHKTKLLSILLAILLLFLATKGIIYHLRTGENTFNSIHNNGITFILSVLSFLIIKNVNINTNNAISKVLIKIAPYTFGVYLIHDNFFIRNILWYRNLFQFESHFDTYYFVPYLLAISILIFVICVCIDKMRSLLFNALQLDKGVILIRVKLAYVFNRFYYKFVEHK